jgi:hypothetical protein
MFYNGAMFPQGDLTEAELLKSRSRVDSSFVVLSGGSLPFPVQKCAK